MKRLLLIVCVLSMGVIHAQQWQDDFAEAETLAKKEDKPIILVFSGSDWCAPCIKLKRNILDSEEFKTYASSNYILYNADFPRKKKNQLPQEKINANKELFAEYNPKGYFPLVVVLDNEKAVLGVTGFNRKKSPEEYIELLNDFVK